jgi:hypothetical protein
MEFIVLLILLTIAYAFSLKFWKNNKFRLGYKNSIYLKYIHFLTFSVSIILFFIGLNLRGIWTSRIIFFIAIFSGIFYNLIAEIKNLNIVEKYYFKFLKILPIIFGALTFIPFLGIVIVASVIGQLTNPYEKIHYNDENIRIQTSFVGVLAGPKIKVYTKNKIFEKLSNESEKFPESIDSLKVQYTKDSINVFVWNDYNENPKIAEKIQMSKN